MSGRLSASDGVLQYSTSTARIPHSWRQVQLHGWSERQRCARFLIQVVHSNKLNLAICQMRADFSEDAVYAIVNARVLLEEGGVDARVCRKLHVPALADIGGIRCILDLSVRPDKVVKEVNEPQHRRRFAVRLP